MFPGRDDYISLIDIAKYKNPEVSADIIKNWLRNSTIEFLGLWERMNNPNYKLVEFHQFKNEAGANAFIFPHLLGNSISWVMNQWKLLLVEILIKIKLLIQENILF
ncbi:KilA-N domain-containing protein [Clostridium tyrobutyricum]|uniref:KilA-N domain-containing protein n=1 Tax=Clostridium tyrobutyricum TaxID=1519 RepID=UPI001C3876E8|nr:KilA-N domain-containing protein [Clostridium tyrobutyricum]MBV4417954.1 KilA-N domain-containing protein [Clostridium tyrobutyricum]